MKFLKHLVGVASLALVSGLVAVSPAHAITGGISYVYGVTSVPANGVSAAFASYKPPLVYVGDYSVGQVRTSSADGLNVVEAGWNVDAAVNGADPQPHLFVAAIVNGRWDGYNLSGHFVWTNHDITPGGSLSGASGTFSVIHWSTGWWLGLNGIWFGYYPDSLFGGTYTQASTETAGGEVYAHTGRLGATQMGSGQIGGAPGAANVNNFTLYGAASQPGITIRQSDPGYYAAGNIGPQSFDYGGAGPNYD